MRIAAYCRVSTDKEQQLDSLRHQKEFFIAYAQRNGHDLFCLYADEGISGTSLKKRDQFNRLMQDARMGHFQAVVVKDISRLARNTVDFLISIRQLKAMGINTIFLTANMDSMGDSEFILTLFSAMAQEESNNLSKRVKWGKKINAEKGRVPLRIFGYDRVDNFTLSINPQEAAIVRKIFSLYVDQGLGCRTISQTLNQNGDKTKCGSDWNPRGVRRILVNPIYQGTLVNHKYEVQDFLTGKQVALPQGEHVHHHRPEWAIVTPEIFQKAQEILSARRRKFDSGAPFPQGRYSGKHLFSTLIKCPHCGRSFTRKTYTYANTRIYWHCVTNDQHTAQRCDNAISLNEPELRQALAQYISSRIANRDVFIADLLAKLSEQFPTQQHPQQESSALESKRRKLLLKTERYQEMYANALITLPVLKEKLAAIQEALRAIDAQPEVPAPSVRQDIMRKQILGFLNLETMTNGDLRQILSHISVTKDGDVHVVLKPFENAPHLPN